MTQVQSAAYNATTPPKKGNELFAWLAFADVERFIWRVPIKGDVVLPTMNSGDAVLFGDQEKQTYEDTEMCGWFAHIYKMFYGGGRRMNKTISVAQSASPPELKFSAAAPF